MGDDNNVSICRISGAASLGNTFVTDGKFLKLRSPFVTKTSTSFGGQISFGVGQLKPKSGACKPKLDFVATYRRSQATQTIDQDDIPILGDIFRFQWTREATTDVISLEVQKQFRSSFLHAGPVAFFGFRGSLGVGALRSVADITEGEEDPFTVSAHKLFATSSVQLDLVEVPVGHLTMSASLSIYEMRGSVVGNGSIISLTLTCDRKCMKSWLSANRKLAGP